MAYFTDCRQGQRVFRRFFFLYRCEGKEEETTFTVRFIKDRILVEILCTLVFRIRRIARPLDAVVGLQFFVRSARILRCERDHFIPDFFRIVVMHGIPHRRCNETENFPVRF